ncbi:MAG TPA: cyclic peptide export ABC transporter [Candidatus Dormibacteraeota bacterium]|nr:cyclic peptide export ABC transporter [Candidatus Dormibacteraeota bacterium]
MVAGIVGALSGIANTLLLVVIGKILSARSSSRLVCGFIALCAFVPASGFYSQLLLTRLTAETGYRLRMSLCQQVLRAPYGALERWGINKLLAVLDEDVPTLVTALASIPRLTTHVAVIVGCLCYLAWLSWYLMLYLAVSLIIGLLGYRLATKKAVHWFRLLRQEWDLMHRAIRTLTEGVKELKINRQRRLDFVLHELDPPMMRVQKYFLAGNSVALGAANAGQVLFFVFIGIVLSVGPYWRGVTHETLIGFTMSVLFIIAPLNAILTTMPNLNRAHLAAERIANLRTALESESPEVPVLLRNEQETAGIRLLAWRKLELSGVLHRYKNGDQAGEFQLGPLDLTFVPGEVVFLVGGNGSGKTTLAKILLGLYEPEAGEVRLDGKTITRACRDDYRQNFSVVFSDSFVFDRLLSLDDARVSANAQDHLRRLQLDHRVKIEGGKFSTIDLSQGQRKRLALVAAYLEDRSIYIFDEWAAEQDPAFKVLFYHELVPELKRRGKAVIVISHDDRFYGLADRIVRLERGRLEYDRRNITSEETPSCEAVNAERLPSLQREESNNKTDYPVPVRVLGGKYPT